MRYTGTGFNYDAANSIIVDNGGNTYVTGYIFESPMNNDYATVKYSEFVGIHPVSNEIPENFKLDQNYPNPFNPNTLIGYQLPINSFVTLKVYDILGRETAVLVNE